MLQMEAVVYLVIGLTVTFLLSASLIFAICQCVSGRKPASNCGEAITNSASEDAFRRQSYLQQSPMTEETISLDDFDSRPMHQPPPLQPQLIYTQEFHDGLGPLESYQYLLVKKRPSSGRRNGHPRPLSSPMSEIGSRHHRPRPRPPRPSSVLDEPYLLSPPPDFSGYTSDVTSDNPRLLWRPEAPLLLSSFRRPTPEEIQRDVDIVFQNLGLNPEAQH